MSRSYAESERRSFTLLVRSSSAICQDVGADALDGDTVSHAHRLLFVVQLLVIPLAMIMGDECRDGLSVMALAERCNR